MGDYEDWLPLVDSQTVQALESTSPGICLTDRHQLSEKMRTGTLFPQIQDIKVRHDIWNRLSCTDTLIPSFRTLFHDIIYLEMIHNVLRSELAISMYPTTAGSLFDSFINNRACTAECTQLRKTYLHCESRTCPHFPDAYAKLWLFAMNHRRGLDDVTFHTDQLLQERPGIGRTPCAQDWHSYFACFVGELGFVGTKSAGVVIEGMKSLEQKLAVTRYVPYVSSDKANAVIRRSGPPRSQEERSVRGYLFMDMLQTPVQNASKFVTPLFLRRCFVQRFFGVGKE